MYFSLRVYLNRTLQLCKCSQVIAQAMAETRDPPFCLEYFGPLTYHILLDEKCCRVSSVWSAWSLLLRSRKDFHKALQNIKVTLKCIKIHSYYKLRLLILGKKKHLINNIHNLATDLNSGVVKGGGGNWSSHP